MRVRVWIPFEASIEYDIEIEDIPLSPKSETWRERALEIVEKVMLGDRVDCFGKRFDGSNWTHDPNFYEQVYDNIKAAFASPKLKQKIDIEEAPDEDE